MKTQRIIPDVMRKPSPEQVIAAPDLQTEAAPKKVTARFENTKEGLCPVCQVQMARSVANGHEVLYCADHSLVMPIRDVDPLPINPNALYGPDTSLC
jgi:hypothetical protein